MTDDLKTTKVADAQVSRRFPRSKTWAVRHLSKFFNKPFFREATTAEDRKAKIGRLRVFCRHVQTGAEIPVCEVAGPAEALPKAALVGACRMIRVNVTFDALGGVSFAAVPLKVPGAPEPASVPPPQP